MLPPRVHLRWAFLGIMVLVAVMNTVALFRFYERTYVGGHHENSTIPPGKEPSHEFEIYKHEGRGLNDSTGPGKSTTLGASWQSTEDGRVAHPFASSTKVQGSAREALSRKLDLSRCRVHQLGSILIQANNTVVAVYYRLPSKHPDSKYDEWIPNFMSIQDPLVVFTQSIMVERVKELRAHAVNRTVVVQCEIDVLPIISLGRGFWKNQLEIDPERSIHKSYLVFWIWLSKSWWTSQAVHLNFFSSTFFLYSDIGSFRTDKFNHKTIVKYPDVVPDGTILWMAHRRPNPPPTYIWTNKSADWHFYHSGSLGAGRSETWIDFHDKFSTTLDAFVAEGRFVGEDQCVLQATCLLNPNLCAYVRFTQVDDDRYFGLRFVLHYGPESAVNSADGRYDFWQPAGWNASSADFS